MFVHGHAFARDGSRIDPWRDADILYVRNWLTIDNG